MADLSSFTSKFRAQRIGPQDAPSTKVTKRPRLSCNQCQRSKRRCDRGRPCSCCTKRGEEAICSYQQPAGSGAANAGRSSVAEDRLLHLESMITQLLQNQTSKQQSENVTNLLGNTSSSEKAYQTPGADAANEQQTPCQNIKYVGSTHWSAILDDIHELKVALGSSVDVRDQTKSMVAQCPTMDREVIYGQPSNYPLTKLLSQFLPPRVEVDRYLASYFQGETFVIPFIHTYHFQREYREFWDDPSKASIMWLSTLFSLCFMASLINGTINSGNSLRSELAKGRMFFHTAAGQCLVLGDYHRPQPGAIEALALYAHCKNISRLDPSREAGAILSMVVRMAYKMGYHRDPDTFGTFTPFEGEMRRRFWAVCKQMDVMISFQLGLPNNINTDFCDTRSPLNLLDSDFDVDTKVLPPSRSENELSRFLWFVVKERQLTSFSKVCHDALSFKEKSEAEVLELDQEIRGAYKTVPENLRIRPLSESIADPPFLIMNRFYIQAIHQKCLCILHRKYMARGNAYSTKCCIEAGTQLVSQIINLYKELVPGGQLQTVRWMFNNFTMNDFLMGVMVLCLVVHTNRKRGLENLIADTSTENHILSLLEESHPICVEKSGASKDAQRVSHAVSLTLDMAKSSSSRTTSDAPQSSESISGTPSNGDSLMGELQPEAVDPASLLLPSWYGYIQGEETAFGMLDPFSFTDYDIDNMDWSIFENPQL